MDFQDEKAYLIAENQKLKQQLQEALERLEQEKLKADQIEEEKQKAVGF